MAVARIVGERLSFRFYAEKLETVQAHLDQWLNSKLTEAGRLEALSFTLDAKCFIIESVYNLTIRITE